ncbi:MULTISPECIES: 3-hydroxyacyl-CoA dehydrogenase/enoyl-CoA hydratase family protein [Haloarcula]|uniref:enoyl-CoA hydratase n=1 Tax=Haloarcula pellucida TaxID=1427151 RepID=A0A830GIH8_9EURY|nr:MULTISPECIES: 3-hydroxyacyl-CoA dehydrogenase/enoyl-CoA hydratase family protein [Halomicroarcula]MBX0347536.1 3-hydroxyacyl-CoA dehydrogenase/enoyl-CoA hydratase family protein [Halomicroarcula pellucida]MDS0276590.1 3-hydroxyacyl-CoA dehydrogenase/enoyl-CoA hydratase family protein [Halomicroarcula sp. S1AR25-4]GGN89158.1 3-hydroxyacyl-CoA dehydrogenase [Halomicroarcula pellucida]
MDFEDIETVAVLGAGNMGHGIAEVAALAGYEVRMRDIKEEFVQNGYDNIEWSLNKLAEKDHLSDEAAEEALERVTALVDVDAAVGDADVVIEAVPEKMEIKKDVYTDVEKYAPEDAIFATNTSSLSITELSEVTERPEQFCGMHFFNPPVRMQLVEVISGEHTSEATLETIEQLAEDFDKTPVRVRKDSPGFIVNRILVPLMNEACWLVHDDVATIAEVDSTTKFDMGLPMGSFELSDQVGNDVGLHVLEYMHEVLGEPYAPCPLLEEKVENEQLGKKTGEGFYDYEDGGVDIPTDAGREDVERRLLAVMANEVGKLVENDVAPVADVDEAVMLGGGFPEGPAKLADKAGLDTLVETLEEVHEARYAVSDGLREAAESGGFYGSDDETAAEFENIALEYPGEMVGHIVLDRPHRMNTVSPDLMDELSEAIDLLEDDDEVRSILVTGAGEKAFSAGADVQSMASNATPLEAVELSKQGQETFGKLEQCSMPVVAGIDGYALGGGMELATCADLRVASERSELGQPEHNLGLLPGWGGTVRLANIVGEGRAKEIIFTAERYDAAEMADYGFVNEVVENDELDDRAFELARDLAAGPPVAQKFTKRAMHAGRDDKDAGLEVESQAFGHLIGTEDVMEGITAFMGDGDPEFEGK